MRQEESRERIIFFGHLLFLGVILLLQTWNFWADYIRPDFVLVFLLISAVFLNFSRILLLTLISFLFLSWRPDFSYEAAILLILPIAAFLARKFVPGKLEIVSFVIVFLGTVVFYSISAFNGFWGNLILAGEVLILNLLFGFGVFQVVSKFLNPSR